MKRNMTILSDSHFLNANKYDIDGFNTFTPTQQTIKNTVTNVKDTNMFYFVHARRQGVTTLFAEDIIIGLLNGDYKKISVFSTQIETFTRVVKNISIHMNISDDDYQEVISKIVFNDDIMYELDDYDYIFVDDFEYAYTKYQNHITNVIQWLNRNKHSTTSLIITSVINDRFDFEVFRVNYINKYNMRYKVVDPELSDIIKERMLILLGRDKDVYRREVLCKRKKEVEEDDSDKSKDIMSDILNMSLSEAISYCNDKGIKLTVSFENK